MEQIKQEALKKLENNLKEQENIINSMTLLPKGHINILYRKEKGYYYLTHREGKKVCNDYLGPVGKCDINNTLDQLNLREKYKKELKRLKEEEKAFRKIVKKVTRNEHQS